MQGITLCFMFVFVAVGLLNIGLAVPLVRRRVKPNSVYGFRTAKTRSSECIWYEANAYAGRMLLLGGAALVMAAVALYIVFRADFIAYNIAWNVVLLSSIAIQVWLDFRHLRSL